MFAIRITNQQDLGLGHLMRMKNLAVALKNQQQNVHIILDDNSRLCQTLFSDFLIIDVINYDDYQADAYSTVNYLQRNQLSHLIIDSYTLGIEYEQLIKQFGLLLTVIDDNERPHDCDFLIDYRWVGKKTKSRYKGKVSDECLRLLGPNYCILSPEYQTVMEDFDKESEVTVLLSLGGGGDLQILQKIFSNLKNETKKNIQFKIVIGPYATNKEAIYAISEEYKNVYIVENVICLKEHYDKASLFIGALGTSLYECVATKTPSITFAIEKNQNNDVNVLEWLGHYLHLNEITEDVLPQLSKLIDMALCQLPRLNALIATKRVSIDGRGAERIARVLIDRKIEDDGFNSKSLDSQNTWKLTDEVTIKAANDTHINSYLAARNLPSNSERMTVQNNIQPWDHYLWWFRQSRSNFVLTERKGEIESRRLYIWHKLSVEGYLYGGWFVCDKDVSLPLAMLALKWQLEFCKNTQPNAIWLAVIHKDNKFVNLLNQYMGFTETARDSQEYKITQKLFPLADEQFNFVMWDPNAQ